MRVPRIFVSIDIQKDDCINLEEAESHYVTAVLRLKIKNEKILDEEKNISALSMYWTFLLVVWLAFFLMIYVFNDAFIEWCKTLVS